jgi:hypothetical protein
VDTKVTCPFQTFSDFYAALVLMPLASLHFEQSVQVEINVGVTVKVLSMMTNLI